MWKLLRCAYEIRNDFSEAVEHGVFVFPVDADDYVNCHIAQWVLDHPNANGFKSNTGYRYVCGQNYVTITPWYGGTMNIMKLYREDLPEELPDESTSFQKEVASALTERYPICWYDIEAKGKFAAIGRPFSELPMRSTVYVVGTGDNLSDRDPANSRKKDRFHPVAFLRKINPCDKRFLTKRLRKEYGMV